MTPSADRVGPEAGDARKEFEVLFDAIRAKSLNFDDLRTFLAIRVAAWLKQAELAAALAQREADVKFMKAHLVQLGDQYGGYATVCPYADDHEKAIRNTPLATGSDALERLLAEAYERGLRAAWENAVDLLGNQKAVLEAGSYGDRLLQKLDRLLKQREAEAIEHCAIEAGERSPEGVSSHTMLGDLWDSRIQKLRADVRPDSAAERGDDGNKHNIG